MMSTQQFPTETDLREWFSEHQDVVIQSLPLGTSSRNQQLVLVYSTGLCDDQQLSQVVLPRLLQVFREQPPKDQQDIEARKPLVMTALSQSDRKQQVMQTVLAGELVLLFSDVPALYVVNLYKPPHRKPDEPKSEIAVRGARDGFVEEVAVNIALIRKRLPAVELVCESFVIGTKSQTKIALLHLKDVASPTVIEEARNRLQSLQQKQLDGITNSAQVEEALSDRKFTIFPLFSYSGRPDFAVSSLLNGRFVLLVDGSSTASIAPVTLFYLLEGSTDSNMLFFFTIFQRWLRLIGLTLAMLLPAFWIALSGYQTDQIPYTLLATVVISRQGVPMSSPIEALMMILLFELFREAGIRLPSAIGQTLSVVGGLIIGQSAISAGLTSPTMLVMIATAAVASFILGNQDLSGTVRLLNLVTTLIASLFGMFGFFITLFAIVLYLVNLRSFGVPYLAPVAPVVLPDLLRYFLPLPWSAYPKRPEVLDPRDPLRQKEETQ